MILLSILSYHPFIREKWNFSPSIFFKAYGLTPPSLMAVFFGPFHFPHHHYVRPPLLGSRPTIHTHTHTCLMISFLITLINKDSSLCATPFFFFSSSSTLHHGWCPPSNFLEKFGPNTLAFHHHFNSFSK